MTSYVAALADGRARLAAAGIDTAAIDCRLLLRAATGAADADLIARGERMVRDDRLAAFRRLIARRVRREPVARILGEKAFYGLDFNITRDVLVPRPDSELLVDIALDRAGSRDATPRICDVGTGSGALLIAILYRLPKARGVGADISPPALAVAQANSVRIGVDARACFVCGDFSAPGFEAELRSAVGGPPFDVVVANPPYVRSGDIERLDPEVARHEPRLALDGGRDGLDAYRHLVPKLAGLSKKGGLAVLETGAGQCRAVAAMLAARGFGDIRIGRDLAGIERCVSALVPAS